MRGLGATGPTAPASGPPDWRRLETVKRVDFNVCILKESSSEPMAVLFPSKIREACDPAWVQARQRDAATAEQDAKKNKQAEDAAFKAWMERYGLGIPFIPVIKNSQHLEGEWNGNVDCAGKNYNVTLRLEGGESGGRGVMFVWPGDAVRGGHRRGQTSNGSAYAVDIVKTGVDLDLRAGKPLVAGKDAPPLQGRARFVSAGYSRSLSLEGAGGGCNGRLSGRLSRH